MEYKIINSGSDGNSIIVNKYLMLDVGVNYCKLKKYLKDIKIIFTSHKHHDHIMPSTVKKIAFEYPNIKFLTREENVETLVELGVNKKNIFVLKLNTWYDLGLFKARLEDLWHDVPNACLKFNIKGFKGIYVVDTSDVSHIKAKDYDFAFVEANYESDEILEQRIKEAEEKGEFTYLKRVKYTHLSELQAYNWVLENNIKNYCWIHQHKDKRGKENENTN